MHSRRSSWPVFRHAKRNPPTAANQPPTQSNAANSPDGNCTHADIAVISEATLTDQPTGKSLEYRIFAINKAGDGAVSNVVDVMF